MPVIQGLETWDCVRALEAIAYGIASKAKGNSARGMLGETVDALVGM